MNLSRFLRGSALAATLALPLAASAEATIVIVNVDGPGEGFNDPTPAAPVGGNPGTTVGQQRLNAFQYAADVWGAALDSDVEIRIQASFDPLTCTATSAVLGSAGAIQVFSDFPNAELEGTWYHVALANKLAGEDLAPGDPGTSADDLRARFNVNLGNPGCFTGSGWYYGLDANHGTQTDLVAVLLHEFGHGLGFANFANEVDGTLLVGVSDVFTTYTVDNTTGKHWNEMTDAERVASAINSRNVAWDGVNVTKAVPGTLAPGVPLLTVTSPAPIAGTYPVGAASFGPALTSPGVSGALVLALDASDAAGPLTTDACSPLTNAAAVAGKIALLDRGTCGFAVKVKNAQDAGAIAVVVADNAPGSPPPALGGTDATVTIPSARVTLALGNSLKAQLGSGVSVTLGVDLSQFAGADRFGRALLNAPDPVQSGSSISHFDPISFPNLLMEPSINADLTHGLDLTVDEMKDIGWFSDGDGVPDGVDACLLSDRRETVYVGSCNSGAGNYTFGTGCRISDLLKSCDRFERRVPYVACVTALANSLRRSGFINVRDEVKMALCAALGRR